MAMIFGFGHYRRSRFRIGRHRVPILTRRARMSIIAEMADIILDDTDCKRLLFLLAALLVCQRLASGQAYMAATGAAYFIGATTLATGLGQEASSSSTPQLLVSATAAAGFYIMAALVKPITRALALHSSFAHFTWPHTLVGYLLFAFLAYSSLGRRFRHDRCKIASRLPLVIPATFASV